jgi:CheY-like chemotaxis protein
MVEQAPREYLTRVLELSQEMVQLARIDPGHEMDLGCRVVFGALCDYGYTLKKMAEEELAAHEPAGASLSEEPSLLAGISSPANPKTVLIVDDDRDFLRYLSLLFQDNGFETLTAANGHEAMELASARSPDLISLDISMPGKSGVSAYRDLKEDPDLRAVPVLLVTAVGASVNRFTNQFGDLPAPVRFVPKPLDVDLLWRSVREILGASSRQQRS